MTKKLKHTLILTLSALFLALTGFALVSSSQSKVNAAETVTVRLIDMYDSSIEYGTLQVAKDSIDTNGDILAFMKSREHEGYCLDYYRLYVGADLSKEYYEDFSNHQYIDLSTHVFIGSDIISVAYSSCTAFYFYSDFETKIGYANVYLGCFYSDVPTAPEKEGYSFKGWTRDPDNPDEIVDLNSDYLVSFTGKDEAYFYAVYEKIETPDNTDTDKSDDSTGIGDKISDVADNVSNWLKDNTGVVFSSGSLIIIAIVLAVVMLSKRK